MNNVCAWLSAHGSSCVEMAGFIFGVINVYLTVREKIWSWPVGILNAATSAVVYYQAGLYSDFGQQFVYIAMSMYGWYHWLHGGANRSTLLVTRTSRRTAGWLLSAGLAGWALFFAITRNLPGTTLPQVDAALVSANFVAQWMMTRKLRETWLLWIVIEVVYIALLCYKGIYLYAALYVIYGVLAILGHIEWTRSFARSSPASS